jgi:hypothetical protein
MVATDADNFSALSVEVYKTQIKPRDTEIAAINSRHQTRTLGSSCSTASEFFLRAGLRRAIGEL